jgi:2-haloacid dehalogenase/putative hydrolase of the HAD superfamily
VIGALAFDFGGTLAEPSPAVSAGGLIDIARERFGEAVPIDAVPTWHAELMHERRWERATGRQRPLSAIVSRLLRACGIEDDAVALVEEYFERIGDGALLSSAAPLLSWAQTVGFKCILASNTYRTERARSRTVRESGLAPLFSSYVLSSEVGVRKPAPDFFAATARASTVPQERIIFIGDTLTNDVLAPLRHGMCSIWVSGPQPSQAVVHPRFLGRVTEIGDIRAIIECWQSRAT